MRWASQNDKTEDEDGAQDGPAEERPVGFVLAKIKIDDEVRRSGTGPVVVNRGH